MASFSIYRTKQGVMVSSTAIQPFALVTVPVLKLINASVMTDGWDWIARSLIALVSHPISLILFALARASVSYPTNATVMMNSEDTSAKHL